MCVEINSHDIVVTAYELHGNRFFSKKVFSCFLLCFRFFSMTQLLSHTFADFTGPSFMPITSPIKKIRYCLHLRKFCQDFESQNLAIFDNFYASVSWNKYLEGQYASLFSSKNSFQFHPAKFENLKAETFSH